MRAVNDGVFGAPRVEDILTYRKIVIAVVATHVGLDEAFVAAVLRDEMDEYLSAVTESREHLKTTHYDDYLSLLAREIIVRYAATAAEGLAAAPGSAPRRIMGDTSGLGRLDDFNAVARVHEIFEHLESPDAEGESEALLVGIKRQLCNYYNATAFQLVHGLLLPVIINAAEEYVCSGVLTAARVRELVIAGQ